MGYRSEVKIVAGRKAADEIRTILAENDSQLIEVGTNDKGETLFAASAALLSTARAGPSTVGITIRMNRGFV